MKYIIDIHGRMLEFVKEQVEEVGNYDSKAELIRDGLKRIYYNAVEHGQIKI